MTKHRLNEDVETALLPAIIDGEPPVGQDGARPSRRRLVAVAAGVACALVLGVVGWALMRPGGPASDVAVVPGAEPAIDASGDAPTASSMTGGPTTPTPTPLASRAASVRSTTLPTTPPTTAAPPSAAPPAPPKPSVTLTQTPTTLPKGKRSLQSVSNGDRYIHQSSGLANLDQVNAGSSLTLRQDASFTIVTGLANANCYSFLGSGNRYLRHSSYRIRADTNDGSTLFKQDATFCARVGSTTGTVLLESSNLPGSYVHRRNFELWLDTFQNTSAFRADGSFRLTDPWG